MQTVNVETGMVKVLTERKDLYSQAIANAKAEGAQSKVRRYERGAKASYQLFSISRLSLIVTQDN